MKAYNINFSTLMLSSEERASYIKSMTTGCLQTCMKHFFDDGYTLTQEGLNFVSSETGMLSTPNESIVMTNGISGISAENMLTFAIDTYIDASEQAYYEQLLREEAENERLQREVEQEPYYY